MAETLGIRMAKVGKDGPTCSRSGSRSYSVSDFNRRFLCRPLGQRVSDHHKVLLRELKL